MQWNEIKYGEWPEHEQKVLIQINNLYFIASFDAAECMFTWTENESVQWGGPKSPIRWTAMSASKRIQHADPAIVRAWHLMSHATVKLFSLF